MRRKKKRKCLENNCRGRPLPFNIDHEVGDSFSLLCAMGQLAAIQVSEVDVLLQRVTP